MAGFDQRSLDDYIPVDQRIAEFRDQHPAGSLRGDFRMIQVGDQHLIAYRAEAWRTPDDTAPGVGCAWELVPGRTPFTRGSELQNAETSAWGRAIIAVGAADAKKGIASREEVEWRRAERELPVNRDGSTSRSRATDEQLEQAGQMTKAQLAAHNKLRRDGEPALGRVEKLGTTPDDDDFYQPREPVRAKPAGWLLSERFAALGVFDRKERLDQCSEIVGRPVGSSSELEPGEVAAVLEALQQRELAR